MKLFVIETENLKLDGGAMFGVVPKKLWEKQYPADENNLCNWAMRCLLIDDGERRILIDNGIGGKQNQKFFSHYHLNGDATLHSSLAAHGYKPEDITDVLLTHLHFDHCGGGVYTDADGKPQLTFPNANYWTSRKQWNWATKPNHRERASFLKENILPMQEFGALKLIDEEGELFPDVHVKFFDGHTDGQVVPYINCGSRIVAFMGDLLPSTVHVPMPWVMAYDTRPLQTLDDKERFYKDALERGVVLFFEHDLYNECCTLHETEKGVRVKETFKLEEIL